MWWTFWPASPWPPWRSSWPPAWTIGGRRSRWPWALPPRGVLRARRVRPPARPRREVAQSRADAARAFGGRSGARAPLGRLDVAGAGGQEQSQPEADPDVEEADDA